MKKVLKFFALASVTVAVAACSGNKQFGEPVPGIAQSSVDSASYALGVSMGMSLKQSGIEPLNLASLYDGIVDGAFGNDLKVSQAELPNIIQTYITRSNIAMADKKTRDITYTVYNYTTLPRTLRLHAQLPKEAVNLTLFSNDHFIDMNDEGKANWELAEGSPSHIRWAAFSGVGRKVFL